MKTTDILSLSLRMLVTNKLRSAITIAIIALGITALIGIVTAIGAMNEKLTESFSSMGANGFSIRPKERNLRLGRRREPTVTRKREKQEKGSNLGQPITLQQAEEFKAAFSYPAVVSLSVSAGNMHSLSFSSKRTSPTVSLFGVDANYLDLNGNVIDAGRNFTAGEVAAGNEVCIVGSDVVERLFGGEPRAAINKEIRIDNLPYRVVGTLQSRGSVFGFSRDNIALATYPNLARNQRFRSFSIGVKSVAVTRVEQAMGEAEGVFRTVRKLAVTEENNFVLERSNSLAERAIHSLRYLTAAVTLIGIITLLGAAIGLMNIMLVAVAERTKEVGLLKAIGAHRRVIRWQFLCEAVLISLAGALIGIALGVFLGNLFALVLHTNFVIPWGWILAGVFICTIVGLAAGVYPAWKAGNLNPTEALRYE